MKRDKKNIDEILKQHLSSDIVSSLKRLDSAKRLSLRKLFPIEPSGAEEFALDEEPSKARGLGEEKA